LVELLNNAKTHRDRSIWALLAGTGIRTHEALNLLESDINGIENSSEITAEAINDYKLITGRIDMSLSN